MPLSGRLEAVTEQNVLDLRFFLVCGHFEPLHLKGGWFLFSGERKSPVQFKIQECSFIVSVVYDELLMKQELTLVKKWLFL